MPCYSDFRWVEVETSYQIPNVFSHRLAYETHEERVIFTGGSQINRDIKPIYFYDGIDWDYIEPSGDWPSWRDSYAMAFNDKDFITILFGGFLIDGSYDYLNDTWDWDGIEWFQHYPLDSPSDRIGHSMCYHSQIEACVLFGGFDENRSFLSDTWIWDGSNWTEVTNNPSPSPRSRSALIYDYNRDLCVLFGGTEDGGFGLDDTWEWDGSGWVEITTEQKPLGRYSHDMVYDSTRGQVVLFGGYPLGGGASDETWEYDGIDW